MNKMEIIQKTGALLMMAYIVVLVDDGSKRVLLFLGPKLPPPALSPGPIYFFTAAGPNYFFEAPNDGITFSRPPNIKNDLFTAPSNNNSLSWLFLLL